MTPDTLTTSGLPRWLLPLNLILRGWKRKTGSELKPKKIDNIHVILTFVLSLWQLHEAFLCVISGHFLRSLPQ